MTPRDVVVHLNSVGLGGSQLNAVDLARSVREYGWRAALVAYAGTIPSGASILPQIHESGLPLHVVPRHTMFWQAAPALARVARETKASVVHTYGSLAARPAYWGACALGRVPLVQTVYEMQVAEGEKEHTPMVVGTGYLVDELQGRPGSVSLISPPVDLRQDRPDPASAAAFRAQHGLDSHQLLLVTVTRLDREMKALSVELAMKAMMWGVLQDLTLVVVGGGDAERELAAQADVVNGRLGRRAVVMTGPSTNPRGAYAAADIVLGMGSSAARGLAFGKPLVVTGENGWFQAFHEATASGLFRNSFWSRDSMDHPVQELVAELLLLVENPDRRGRLGRFGRDFAVGSFGLSAMAERLACVYEQAVSDYGARQWLGDLPTEIARTARGLGRRAIAMPAALS